MARSSEAVHRQQCTPQHCLVEVLIGQLQAVETGKIIAKWTRHSDWLSATTVRSVKTPSLRMTQYWRDSIYSRAGRPGGCLNLLNRTEVHQVRALVRKIRDGKQRHSQKRSRRDTSTLSRKHASWCWHNSSPTRRKGSKHPSPRTVSANQ